MDLKTGQLDWRIPADLTRFGSATRVTKPLLSNGIVYIVKDSKLLAVPLEAGK